MSINKVIISGNLTRDPEKASTTSGTDILKFGMAVNDRRQNKQTGEWEDVPNFVECVLFGGRVNWMSHELAKGSKVAVQGRLSYSSWEKDGERRSKLEVVVEEIEVLTQRKEDKPKQPKLTAQQARDALTGNTTDEDVYDEEIPF